MEGAEEENAKGKAQRVTPLALKMTLQVNHPRQKPTSLKEKQ